MIAETKPLAEITQHAIRILFREIGVVNTMRFINQYTTGYGNYTEERHELFADQTLDDLVREIKQRRQITIYKGYTMSNYEQNFTEQQYVDALKNVEITDVQKAILQEHCNSVEYIDSASNLAKKLGYGHYTKVSNNYSRLSEQLGTAIGYQPDLRDDGSKIWWPVLYDEAGTGSPIPLKLYPNLVKALVKSGIVKQ